MGAKQGKMGAVAVREYLILPHYAVSIEDSAYESMFRVVRTDFHISREALVALEDPPPSAPPDCDIAYRLRADADRFELFHQAWLGSNADLFRGFPGCHFSIPNLVGTNSLESEGMADLPTFTMGNATPTRWLPTAADFNLCAGVAYQCTDAHTQEIARTNAVPMGFVVRIVVGATLGIPIAWLNAGEIVVRGPLVYPQFDIHTIVWLDHLAPRNTPWPPTWRPSQLAPQRPYQPGRPAVEAWWAQCAAWVATLPPGSR